MKSRTSLSSIVGTFLIVSIGGIAQADIGQIDVDPGNLNREAPLIQQIKPVVSVVDLLGSFMGEDIARAKEEYNVLNAKLSSLGSVPADNQKESVYIDHMLEINNFIKNGEAQRLISLGKILGVETKIIIRQILAIIGGKKENGLNNPGRYQIGYVERSETGIYLGDMGSYDTSIYQDWLSMNWSVFGKMNLISITDIACANMTYSDLQKEFGYFWNQCVAEHQTKGRLQFLDKVIGQFALKGQAYFSQMISKGIVPTNYLTLINDNFLSNSSALNQQNQDSSVVGLNGINYFGKSIIMNLIEAKLVSVPEGANLLDIKVENSIAGKVDSYNYTIIMRYAYEDKKTKSRSYVDLTVLFNPKVSEQLKSIYQKAVNETISAALLAYNR